ncbi:MAG: hypothetical protein A3H91_10835 [Gammaproteobacteria bacterium RIFCSPLOWO2_02_FULL_61_13]|nr:MAG: hypothetical protein A3H91_10835 [Gammaproteobacteria bacterium RIFCSPLOWO2_02_FULL_61_13]
MNAKSRFFVTSILLAHFSGPATAGGSAEASARALEHSMQAIGYSIQGGLKLVSGAAALPFMVAGEIGRVSGEAGRELWEEANAPPLTIGPLPVTDEIVTAGPKPGDQLNQPE